MNSLLPGHQPQFSADRIWSVSELNHAVKQLLEQTLQPIWLRGEVSDLTVHRSGHVYFSLKDSNAQLSAVFFRGAQIARRMKISNGMELEVLGRATVYERRGRYQLIVNRLRSRGVGRLQQEFEKLKRGLREEGLFDEERKLSVPMLPKRVGLVTSPQGAAIRDFLRIIERRFADIHIRIVPVAVQGECAAGEIATAIDFLNRADACDVIVVTRGGGGLEDLWAFNEEAVARAVSASQIPVVSAVGHERDFTICDFAADMRVATPSAAAEMVVAAKAELNQQILTAGRRLSTGLQLKLSRLRARFERASHSYVFREPGNLVRNYQQTLDELLVRLPNTMAKLFERAHYRIDGAAGKLTAMDPGKVLERGYAIVRDSVSNDVLRQAGSVCPGDSITAVLGRGSIKATVDSVCDE